MIYLSNRDGNGKTNEKGHLKLISEMLEGQTLTSNDLLVTENSPLGLSVLVQPGDYKIDTADDYSYMGWIEGTEAVTISGADPSNPRITSIILYVDKGASTSASPPNNPGITKLLAVNGTPSGTPTAPNNTTIQTAVVAGNPWIKLADVLVGTGVTQVTNANITDTRTRIKLSDNVLENSNLAEYVGPLLFPIGSIYTNAVDGTNPATLLGFGTWTEFAQGRVPVGISTIDTEFNAPLETGGTKTETLTTGQLPAHAHVVDPPATGTSGNGNHTHRIAIASSNAGSGTGGDIRAANVPSNILSNHSTTESGNHSHTVDIGAFWSSNTGSNQAHNNLQPYIVVYMWRRVA